MRSKRPQHHRPKHFGRELRVADFIQVELTDLIRNKARDPRILSYTLSVTDVRVSKDLAYADVYVSSSDVDSEKLAESIVEALTNAAGFFRSELAQRHSMRLTPEIRFHYDTTESDAARVEALLAKTRLT